MSPRRRRSAGNMDGLRRVHRNINDCVASYFTHAEKPPMVAACPPATLHLRCDKLTPVECGHVGAMMSRGEARRVRVDCLLYDDAGMGRLTSAVPLHKIEMDFTDLFGVPDLVSDSDDD